MATVLHPFEYIGVKQAYEEQRFLIADDPGLFKTAQAVLVNNKIREKKPKTKTLVVCPTSVKEHWIREVSKWGHPRGQSIEVLTARNYSSAALRARRSDWTIVHYPLLSVVGEDGLRLLDKINFDQVILDEVHNAKNPEAIRTASIRRLTDAAEYVTLLSGTPVPNTIEDIYVLMHFLDPEKYPLSDEPEINRESRQRFKALYWEDPQAFKNLIQRKMIRRKARDYIWNLPQVTEEDVLVEMTGNWLDIYQRILETRMQLGSKIMQLEKALLDTDLVDSSLIERPVSLSPKYEELDRIVEEEVDNGGKVLAFTNLKVGVIDKLLERYKRYGAIAITGDVPADETAEREHRRQQFQRDQNTKVLFATTTMNEGVDITAATAVVNLTLPWTPAEYLQRKKRSDRVGEVEKERLKVYNLIAKYPSRLRKSLDQAKHDMLEAKQRVVDYLLSGIRISSEELTEMQTPTKIPRIKYTIKSDNQIVFEHYLKWRNVGTESALRRINKNPDKAQRIAELYPRFNMARNSAALYIPIISELSPQEPWLDIAGGPGMLGYYSEKPVHVLDIDFEHLRIGREMGTGKHVNGTFSRIPYRDGSFGLVV